MTPSIWSRRASSNRGILRVIQVTLSASTHYVLTLNDMPVDSDDSMNVLIHRACHEWAEASETLA